MRCRGCWAALHCDESVGSPQFAEEHREKLGAQSSNYWVGLRWPDSTNRLCSAAKFVDEEHISASIPCAPNDGVIQWQ